MTTGTPSPESLYGYEVQDSAGNKLGSVDGVWVDDATSELEFIGVKTGWLMGKTHIIPAATGQVSDGTFQVPYSEDQVKNAPTFGSDAELSPEQEDEIYSYYGVDRSTAASPTGLPTGAADSTTTGTSGVDTYATDTSGVDTYATDTAATTGVEQNVTDVPEEQRVRLHEEELQVGKRQVEAGRVRLRKVVRTEQVEEPVELRREQVDIERVPVSDTDVPDNAFQEQEIDVPVMREEPVVAKEARATGEVRVGKDVTSETRTVGDEVRREDVTVDRDVDTDVTDRSGTSGT